MIRIAIVNYGVGNIKSIYWGVERAGGRPEVVEDLCDTWSYDGVVLPGQGAFESAALKLRRQRERILRIIDREIPILGICLGMQLLFTTSEECVGTYGLGVLKGHVKRLPPTVKLPHMGWNVVRVVNRRCPLIMGLPENPLFYFAHSYYVVPEDPRLVVSTTYYGTEFPSIIQHKSLYGVQFHPERSSSCGSRLLRNFILTCGGKL